MKKEMQYAWLSNETGYTVFRFDDKVIRFRAPYSLERYTAVKEWDHGYLVVMASISTMTNRKKSTLILRPSSRTCILMRTRFYRRLKGCR